MSLSVFSCLIFVNKFFMMIEDIIFPSLKEIHEEFFNHKNKVVFVTGHQRSATTNVHKAISSLPDVTTGSQFDLLFPSLIMKHIFGPFISIVNKIVFRNFVQQDEIKGHKIGVYEEMEEQQVSVFHWMGVVLAGLLYPNLGNDVKFFEKAVDMHDFQLDYIKRVMVRSIHY
jgi:hypothetical protein